jgi:hypothetical protein
MNELMLFITGGIGAVSTFIVAHDLKQGVVRASAGLSLIVGLFFYAFPDIVSPELVVDIPLVFFGASFVGMTGIHVVKRRWLMLLGGIIFSGIYLVSSEVFVGYGGKLGTTACISSLIVLGLGSLIGRFRKGEV